MATSHSVRRFRICPHCDSFGDSDDMVRHPETSASWHGSCWIAAFGRDSLLALPSESLLNLCLNDIGADTMKAVLRTIEARG